MIHFNYFLYIFSSPNLHIDSSTGYNDSPFSDREYSAFGGSCLVSQAPFDYLHGKHGKELGIIWIDTHPDVSTTKEYFKKSII